MNAAGKSGVDSAYGITGMTQGLTDGTETVVKIDEIKTLSGNTPTTTGNMYGWNQKGGVTASSTGNMTGVYDLSGGNWERTASYIANEHENLLKQGESITYEGNILKTASTKYTMVYPHNKTVDNSTNENTEDIDVASQANYEENTKIYGDAIRETSMAGTGSSSWQNEYSYFAGLNGTFLIRGGVLHGAPKTGRFYFYRSDGYSNFAGGFRPVIISTN